MLAHIEQCEEIDDISQHRERIQKAKSTQNHASMVPETNTKDLLINHINTQLF
jgi:hypothetical protein